MGEIKRVGILGSGLMGTGIAQVAAQHEFDVVLRSRTLRNAQAAVKKIESALKRLVDKEKLTAEAAKACVGRITPTEKLQDLSECQLVVESAAENIEVKRELFLQLDQICKPECILATNTSTLSVTDLAAATQRPDRVVGIHFFNPAPLMALVEVVPALTTSDEVVERAKEFARACGKNPVQVQDRAGFIVNALLFPYLNNAVRLLELGVAGRDDIDTAMKDGCGFPLGPLAVLDLVGLDVSVSILNALYEEYGDPSMRPMPLLKRMVAAGQLGRKSGKGFYDYA